MKAQRILVLVTIVAVNGVILLKKSQRVPLAVTSAQTDKLSMNATAVAAGKSSSSTIAEIAPPTSWDRKMSEIQGNTESLFGPSADENMPALQAFIESIPLDQMPAALTELQQLQSQNPTVRGKDMEMRLIRRWAVNNPNQAAQWAAQMPADVRQDAVTAASEKWAEKDFSAATNWVAGLTDESTRLTAINAVIGQTVYSNPQGALTMAADLPQDANRDQLIKNAAGGWAANAPEDAIAWAKQITDDGLRQQVISAIATGMADKNPASAADLAVDSLPAGKVQQDTVLAILQRWGMIDPTAANAWVKEFPDPDFRQTALDTIANGIERSKSPTF